MFIWIHQRYSRSGVKIASAGVEKFSYWQLVLLADMVA
jgi:hypothetical protein